MKGLDMPRFSNESVHSSSDEDAYVALGSNSSPGGSSVFDDFDEGADIMLEKLDTGFSTQFSGVLKEIRKERKHRREQSSDEETLRSEDLEQGYTKMQN